MEVDQTQNLEFLARLYTASHAGAYPVEEIDGPAVETLAASIAAALAAEPAQVSAE